MEECGTVFIGKIKYRAKKNRNNLKKFFKVSESVVFFLAFLIR